MISAVVLTHDDEDCLPRTLESLTWCDEIVIVDDFSSDQTVAVSRKYTTKIYRQHLAGDFAKQRNVGLLKAKGEWVLFVDSDEIVSKELASEIQKVALATFPVGYYIKRRDYMWGRELKHGETSHVRLLRMARKDAGHWRRPVHEVWEVSGKVGELENPLFHFPHPNVAQFLREINEYSSLNARYLAASGVRVTLVQILLWPLGKFLLNYFWFGGFLDGVPGAILAIMMSFHSFLTRAKLWLIRRKRV